jgi:hypothetical protein
MTRNLFFLQLAVLTLAAATGLWFLLSLPSFQPFAVFSWCSLGLFFLLTIAMYFSGYSAAKSNNKNDFTTVAIGFSGGKIFLSAILILIFTELAKPESKLFILPFFGIYVLYTIFEVYFMMRLGRLKP